MTIVRALSSHSAHFSVSPSALLLELRGKVEASGGTGGVAPVLNHWLLDLLGVPPGLGADLLGDINTLLDFLKTK